MALLDLQGMQWGNGGHGHGNSTLSVALCWSQASVTIC
jgi:hypothetical protein